MKISELLDSIRKYDLVLPEFQREYVWSREQAKQLMVSLVKSYPVGGLLLWKTDQPPELKNVHKLPDKLGTVQVLLDGQQRLSTLHMLIAGVIPIYYTEAEIENDPRDLYVHLHDLEFQFYQRSKMQDDPCWQRVIDCFEIHTPIRPTRIAQAIAKEGEDALEGRVAKVVEIRRRGSEGMVVGIRRRSQDRWASARGSASRRPGAW